MERIHSSPLNVGWAISLEINENITSMRSIKTTTTFNALICVTIIMSIFSVGGYQLFKNELEAQFNRELENEFKSVGSVARIWPDGDFYIDLDFDMASQYEVSGTSLFQVWDVTGREIIDQAPAIEATGEYLAHPTGEPLDERLLYDFSQPTGKQLRGLINTISAQVVQEDSQSRDQDKEIQLLVAKDLTPLNNAKKRMLQYSLLFFFSILVVVSLALVYTIRKALKPLDDLVEDISTIESSGQKLQQRLRPEELSSVSQVIDALIARLDVIVKRERRYNSNIAHELRTPISELRIATDIALKSSVIPNSDIIQNPGRLLIATKQANSISISMSNLVNTMLSLVRLESGELQVKYSNCCLNTILDTMLLPFEQKLAARGLNLKRDCPIQQFVMTDKTLLETILKNLIDNAVEYSSAGTLIELIIETTNFGIQISISNFVDGFNVRDLDELFAPFWKSDKSRFNKEHYGLGLAITNEAVSALRGGIKTNYSNGKLQFVVELPQHHSHIELKQYVVA